MKAPVTFKALLSLEPIKTNARMYTDTAWIKDAEKELKSASHAVVTSYIFNSKGFFDVLLKRLKKKSRDPFTCLVLVDDAAYEENKAPHERRMLKELKDDGAQVWLCTGRSKGGIFHWKALLLDSRIVYWGTANLTNNSLNSRDLMQRLTGPAIDDFKAGIDEAMAAGRSL